MPAPAFVVSNPRDCMSEIASRKEGRDTPIFSASSRSDGNRSPGRRMPRKISISI
jgi:hypothetical protein